MKTRAYIRIGYDKRRGLKAVEANAKPNNAPLKNSRGVLPTVAFAVDLEIPDDLFAQAAQVIATLEIPESAATIAAEVTPVGEGS